MNGYIFKFVFVFHFLILSLFQFYSFPLEKIFYLKGDELPVLFGGLVLVFFVTLFQVFLLGVFIVAKNRWVRFFGSMLFIWSIMLFVGPYIYKTYLSMI